MNFDQPSIDTREFSPEPDICPDCEADLVDDGHAQWCPNGDDFYEPRDEHDSPIDDEVEL